MFNLTIKGDKTMDKFLKKINQLRLKNKDNWYVFQGTFNSKKIKIKGFNT